MVSPNKTYQSYIFFLSFCRMNSVLVYVLLCSNQHWGIQSNWITSSFHRSIYFSMIFFFTYYWFFYTQSFQRFLRLSQVGSRFPCRTLQNEPWNKQAVIGISKQWLEIFTWELRYVKIQERQSEKAEPTEAVRTTVKNVCLVFKTPFVFEHRSYA